MNRTTRSVIRGVVVSTITATVLAAPAAHAESQPSGPGVACAMQTSNDPFHVLVGGEDVQMGLLWGGPVVVPDAASVQLHCEIRLNADPSGQTGVQVASADSFSSGSIGFLAPTMATFSVDYYDLVWVCGSQTWMPLVGGPPQQTALTCVLATTSWIRLPTGDYIHTNGAVLPASTGPE